MIKCVIWDLDNTIWDGVISELSDVKLRNDVIEVLSKLNQKGIISSISSRNDCDITMEKLKSFGISHFFIYPQISWCEKSISVKNILNSLHLRPHNVLFVDDNEFERDEVKSAFPDILTNDASNILNLLSLNGIEQQVRSIEATKRVELYKLDEKRIKASERFEGNNIEFLMNCQIKMSVDIATESDIDRIEELIERTNQLNSTGFRYNIKQIKEMLYNPLYQIYIATVWDKYGSYGKSGLVIAKLDNKIYEISLFIVSCRLMGKGVAQALLSYFSNFASDKQYNKMRFLFKRNKFNRQMILLYTMNGFKKVKQDGDIDVYEMNLNHPFDLPNWVEICKVGGKSYDRSCGLSMYI